MIIHCGCGQEGALYALKRLVDQSGQKEYRFL